MEKGKYHRIKPNVQRRTQDRATVTPRESTLISGIGIAATFRLLRSGQMPALKVGRKFLIPRSALIKWLDESANQKVVA